MENRATFRFRCSNPSILMQALLPDIYQENYSRSFAECSVSDENTLILTISADDIHALRASLNMWLRLIGLADEIVEYTRQSGEEIHEFDPSKDSEPDQYASADTTTTSDYSPSEEPV